MSFTFFPNDRGEAHQSIPAPKSDYQSAPSPAAARSDWMRPVQPIPSTAQPLLAGYLQTPQFEVNNSLLLAAQDPRRWSSSFHSLKTPTLPDLDPATMSKPDEAQKHSSLFQLPAMQDQVKRENLKPTSLIVKNPARLKRHELPSNLDSEPSGTRIIHYLQTALHMGIIQPGYAQFVVLVEGNFVHLDLHPSGALVHNGNILSGKREILDYCLQMTGRRKKALPVANFHSMCSVQGITFQDIANEVDARIQDAAVEFQNTVASGTCDLSSLPIVQVLPVRAPCSSSAVQNEAHNASEADTITDDEFCSEHADLDFDIPQHALPAQTAAFQEELSKQSAMKKMAARSRSKVFEDAIGLNQDNHQAQDVAPQSDFQQAPSLGLAREKEEDGDKPCDPNLDLLYELTGAGVPTQSFSLFQDADFDGFLPLEAETSEETEAVPEVRAAAKEEAFPSLQAVVKPQRIMGKRRANVIEQKPAPSEKRAKEDGSTKEKPKRETFKFEVLHNKIMDAIWNVIRPSGAEKLTSFESALEMDEPKMALVPRKKYEDIDRWISQYTPSQLKEISSQDSEGASPDAEFGKVAASRPRRNGLGTSSFLQLQQASVDDISPYSLITCDTFSSAKPQPFRVIIDSNAMLLLDLHSHLATTEIIGYLAGTWDAESKVLHVHKAVPCSAIEDDQTERDQTVEMAPTSEMRARQRIDKLGYRILGWYHSHPTFRPEPSVRDIENQQTQQSIAATDDRTEPFIGLIDAPYELGTSLACVSDVNCFWVERSQTCCKSIGVFGNPMRMHMSVQDSETLDSETVSEMEMLLNYYASHPSRVKMSVKWRNGYTKAEKLAYAVRHRMPKTISAAQSHDISEYIKQLLHLADVAKFR